MSSGRYPTLLSFLMSPSMREETIHLPPASDIVGEVEVEVRTWALELEYAGADEQRRKKAWIER